MSISDPLLADTVILADCHLLIERSLGEEAGVGAAREKKFVQLFACLSGLMQDFVHFCSTKKPPNTHDGHLTVFGSFSEAVSKRLQDRLDLWYPEVCMAPAPTPAPTPAPAPSTLLPLLQHLLLSFPCSSTFYSLTPAPAPSTLLLIGLGRGDPCDPHPAGVSLLPLRLPCN